MSLHLDRQTDRQTDRQYSVQELRGIAIIAVLMIHTAPWNGYSQPIIRPFVNPCVPLFLFLAGYLTKLGRLDVDSILRLYRKRILRIIYPYLVWTIIYTFIIDRQPEKILYNIITTKAAFHLYYVFVYIQLIILTPLIMYLFRSAYNKLLWLIMPISILIMQYIPLLGHLKYSDSINLLWGLSCLGWFSYYLFGLVIGNKILVFNSYNNLVKWFMCVCLSIILQIIEGIVWQKMGAPDPGISFKISTAITNVLVLIMCCYYLANRKKNNRLLVALGDSSFGIYLSHIAIRSFLYRVDIYTNLIFPFNTFLLLVISLFFVCIGRKIVGKKIGTMIGFY